MFRVTKQRWTDLTSVFRRLYGFYRTYLRWLYLSLGLLVIATALGLVYPYLLKMIVNQVIIGGQYSKLPTLALLILAAAVLKGIFNWSYQFCGQYFGSRTGYDLRNALYRKLNLQSFQYYDDVHTGDLMSRMTADLDAFRMFLAFGVNGLVNLILIVIFGLGLMYSMNVWLALVVTCIMPVLALTAVRFDNRLRPTYQRIRKTLGVLNSGVQENIMGMRTVKSFSKEDSEISKFRVRNEDYFDSNMDATHLWKKFFPFIEFTGNVGVVAIVLVGGLLVIHQNMNLGDLVAFLTVLWMLIWPMSGLGFLLNNLTQSVAAGERLLGILEEPDTLERSNGLRNQADKHRATMVGAIEFDDVSMKYGEERVMKDISFSAAVGETIALIGLTGAGKSTLVNLLPRFYDVERGAVRIDGLDVRDWDVQALRRQIAVVFQEPFLFSTTIFSNIAYGNPEASMEQVRRAAEMADAAEFIDRLPEKYYTLVGERGLGLSGGQKQRIALARAILMDPSILILDDATSAVDMETEFKIQQDLQRVMKGRTTLIIAHRISSVKRADQILVIGHGKIVQRGRHEQLLRDTDGLYRKIFDMQFQDFESVTSAGGGGVHVGQPLSERGAVE